MIFSADFETTTDRDDCRVWAYALCEIGNPDNFIYGNNLDDMMQICSNGNHVLYFHNLKFDGEYLLVWLFEHGFKHVKAKSPTEDFTFTTLISDSGQFYSLEIMFASDEFDTHKTKIYDSLKIIPFGVEAVAKGFSLPVSKLKLDYHEFREIGHELTTTEIEYIKHDVLIMALALDIMFKQGLTQMTQGSNAFHNYKEVIGHKNFKRWYPVPTYDADIRQAYKGGFTYCDPRFQGKDIGPGIVLDVNSLYPSIMYYNKLPYGEGVHFDGSYQTDDLYDIYVQMFSCQFELKKGYIPTIQDKSHRYGFLDTEYLRSSKGEDIALCLTSVDLELFLRHYDVYNINYHGGWKFKSTVGLFKDYIDKWNGEKVKASLEGNDALRTLAKLMLNALYGKFALNPHVQSKYPWYDHGRIRYSLGDPEMRDPIYVPTAAFITAGARYKTITSAQSVYDRFAYADTDSLHLIGKEIPVNLDIDPVQLGAWKHESNFQSARFIRQKTYAENTEVNFKKALKMIRNDRSLRDSFHMINGHLTKFDITCAGMPKSCYAGVTWENFVEGSSFGGKLRPEHVPGGIVLVETEFTIKEIRK